MELVAGVRKHCPLEEYSNLTENIVSGDLINLTGWT